MKKLLFVDDESCVLQGLQPQFHGMRQEWDMHFVESGPAALAHMAKEQVDVIVSDMMMPALDGAQLLGLVAKLYPHTVRLIFSGHADRDAVLRLAGPAHQYLSKPCHTEELRSAISRASALRELLTNDQLKELASRLGWLPSLPDLHQQLTIELVKEEPSIERVSEIISRDVGMSGKILQLVNSAFFGLPKPARTPYDAICFLGLPTIRALVLSVQVFSQFDPSSIRDFSVEQLAAHSWKTAQAAKKIARLQHCEGAMPDQCFLAGLLHDVGQLILASELPRRYAGVLRAALESNRPLWQVELAEFGTTHAEVGAYLLGSWRLPNPVVEAVALHHRPAACVARGFSPAIAVHAADFLTHQSNGANGATTRYEIDAPSLAALGAGDCLDSWKKKCAEVT